MISRPILAHLPFIFVSIFSQSSLNLLPIFSQYSPNIPSFILCPQDSKITTTYFCRLAQVETSGSRLLRRRSR